MALFGWKLYSFLLLIIFTLGDCQSQPENEDEDVIELVQKKKNVNETKPLPPCNPDKLVAMLAELQAITPESIINLATNGDVEVVCHNVKKNVDSIESYLNNCEPPHEKTLYFQLTEGIRALYAKLCKDDVFKKEFASHMQCYKDLHQEYDDCSGPADWQENTDKIFVCKSYADITDCYFVKTAMLCGKKAARTMKELMLLVINKIITTQCDNVQKEPSVKNPMSESSKVLGAPYLALLVALSLQPVIAAITQPSSFLHVLHLGQ